MSTEVFNSSKVKSVMGEVESDFSELSSLIEETNTLITTALGSPDKAVYGDAGNKILATWDENCSTLNSFIKIYDNWSLMAVSIANEYGDLESGTAKVEGTDVDDFKILSNANKTTWLKTSEGAKNYTGSDNTYKSPENGNIVKESNNLKDRRQISYTDSEGNKITEYYNLAGELVCIKKNDRYYDANGDPVSAFGTKEELAREEEVKKAQKELKASIEEKHKAQAEKERKKEEERKKLEEEMERLGKTTDLMQKVADTAANNSGSGYDGYCEAWVERQWTRATGMQSEAQPSAVEGWHNYGVSTSMDNIPVGAMVYGSGSTNFGTVNPYGHVGIYIGNGMVADQGGVVSLEKWISWQHGICDGKQGWLGWGWQNNVDLSKA